MPLILSFDIGYASIGWCVLSSEKNTGPAFLGTGVVTFPSDDCLASQRRALRRTRRHIRSTRQRIERMKKWLQHRGVLTRADLDKPGHPAPFLLAAAALQGHKTLDAWELWTVLRWYAHNRGYDGNSRWSSREEADSDDTEKEKAAHKLMQDHGTATMCETVCACLGLDPAKHKTTISSHLPYKTLNAAYPRATVQNEVHTLLQNHLGKIPGLDEKTLDLLFTPEALTKEDRSLLEAANIQLPKRYHGGLLFGQLVPRFDNRIISRCPITWAKTYDEQIAAGKTDKEARKQADKFAKVPAAKCPEFLGYRFAMLLANLKVDEGRPLPPELRRRLWDLAQTQGRLTRRDLKKEIAAAGFKLYNFDATFIHPDSDEALTLDPVTEFPQKTQVLKPVWELLDEATHKEALACWRKGHSLTLAAIGRMAGKPDTVIAAFKTAYAASQKRSRKKESVISFDDFLEQPLAPKKISGRAPYARPVLKQVIAEVLDGHHPRKANLATDPEKGEDKPANGVLYDLGLPNSRVRQLMAERPIDQLTNNHLVRHRMLILECLLDDIIAEFCTDGKAPGQIIVEVARELKEFSGMTNKEIKSELTNLLKNHKAAVEKLKADAPHLPINANLIRKCRIAMDLDWKCPYTNNGPYEASSLPDLTFDHIIPHATRKTNALHALVLTPRWVNELKGKRTATQFIEDIAGDQRFVSPEKFKKWAEDHGSEKKPIKGKFKPGKKFPHIDDAIRCHNRRKLLLIRDFDDKELGFTEGQLTQTSHLTKLAIGELRVKKNAAGDKILAQTPIHTVPGIITSEVRKSWQILGCLGCPNVCGNDALRWIRDYDIRLKTFVTDTNQQYPVLHPVSLIKPQKSKKPEDLKLPPNAFFCPNGECKTPLEWPESTSSSGNACSFSKVACPHCNSVLRRVAKTKEEIRDLTHLHHAIDAATLALIAHYFPLVQYGENQTGTLWKAIANREKTEDDIQILKKIQLYRLKNELNDKGKNVTKGYLFDLPADLKNALAHSLAESRVMQHIPADRSGTKAKLTTWGVQEIKDGQAKLRQRSFIDDSGKPNLNPNKSRKRSAKEANAAGKDEDKHWLRLDKLLGPQPKNGQGKLKAIKGAMIIGENYGLALDPKPEVIPFHQVHQRLEELRAQNHGKPVRVLRNGMLFEVKEGNYKGVWLLRSIADGAKGLKVRISKPSYIPDKTSGVTWAKDNVQFSTLRKGEIVILPRRYTGHPITG